MELLLQPLGLWEAHSISTLDNNKAKYSLRKSYIQLAGKKKFTVNFQACFSSCLWYLTACTSAWQILDLIPFPT